MVSRNKSYRAPRTNMKMWIGVIVMVCVLFVVAAFFVYKPAPKVVIIQQDPLKEMRSTPHASIHEMPEEPPVYPKNMPKYPLRHQPSQFQQVGVLVSQDSNEDKPVLLGLFGKKMDNRDRWEYYVASDKFHMYKLPTQYKNRMCDEDVGCEEIYNGDDVVVPDYANKVFKARIYKYDTPTSV